MGRKEKSLLSNVCKCMLYPKDDRWQLVCSLILSILVSSLFPSFHSLSSIAFSFPAHSFHPVPIHPFFLPSTLPGSPPPPFPSSSHKATRHEGIERRGKDREQEGKKRGTRKGKGGIDSFPSLNPLFCCATNPREGNDRSCRKRKGAREEINTNSPLLSFSPLLCHTQTLFSRPYFFSHSLTDDFQDTADKQQSNLSISPDGHSK